MAQGIQAQVGVVPSIGVEGDFASSNPRNSVLAGPGAFVAGPNGLYVGRFAWASAQYMDPDNAPAVLNNTGNGPVTGFIHRAQQGTIPFLPLSSAHASLLILPGQAVGECFAAGDFFVRNNGSAQAYPGMKAYANLNNGLASFGATGAAPTVSLTTSSIAAATAMACTGSISGNVLTVPAAPTAGTIVRGMILTGTGVPTGLQVVAQLSGTPGGAGTYALNFGELNIASEAIAGTNGILTVGGGGPAVSGGTLSGTGVTAGTVVWDQLTATTWNVSPSQTATSTTITETLGVETKWIAMSGAAVGELLKISSTPLG